MIWESWGFSRFRVLDVVHPWWWYPALLSDFIFYVRWGCLIPWTTETAKIVIQYFSFLIWLNLLPILLEEAALVDKAHLDLQLNPPAPCFCLSAEKNASNILVATTTKKSIKERNVVFAFWDPPSYLYCLQELALNIRFLSRSINIYMSYHTELSGKEERQTIWQEQREILS